MPNSITETIKKVEKDVENHFSYVVENHFSYVFEPETVMDIKVFLSSYAKQLLQSVKASLPQKKDIHEKYCICWEGKPQDYCNCGANNHNSAISSLHKLLDESINELK